MPYIEILADHWGALRLEGGCLRLGGRLGQHNSPGAQPGQEPSRSLSWDVGLPQRPLPCGAPRRDRPHPPGRHDLGLQAVGGEGSRGEGDEVGGDPVRGVVPRAMDARCRSRRHL
jgi:hypothetical protein